MYSKINIERDGHGKKAVKGESMDEFLRPQNRAITIISMPIRYEFVTVLCSGLLLPFFTRSNFSRHDFLQPFLP